MNFSNLEFCASMVKTQCEEESLVFMSPQYCYVTVLRSILLRRHWPIQLLQVTIIIVVRLSLATCHYQQPIRRVSSYCQQTEHEQDVQLCWPEEEQGKYDAPVSLLLRWPVAVHLLSLRAAWLTTDSPASKAMRCVVGYWQSNFWL